MTKKRVGLTGSDVNRFLKLTSQMKTLLDKMATISSKTPDLVANKFKIGIINEQLRIANELLGQNARPFESFTVFDEAALPTNSDVIVVLSQYLACLETWRSEHVVYDEDGSEWVWDTVDDALIETRGPSNRGEE